MSGATENTDGSRKNWVHGATIVRGEVQFASVSSLELGSRCLRRWAFRYGPHKLQDPPSDATDRGNKYHAEVAKYLTTGSRAHLSPGVTQGLSQIPPPTTDPSDPSKPPGWDLFVEYPFVPDLPGGKSGKANALLRADGIPIIGAIDLLHERPENYGVQDITDARDEAGVLKLVDWKFPGSMKNIKEGHELIETLQMSGYARWGFLRFPQVQKIRLSHCYFPVRGQPRHTTALVSRDEVEDSWKRADAIGVSLRYAAREPDPNRVDANTNDCEAYGKPCPALVAGVCTANKTSSIGEYVGTGQAERLIAAASLVRPQSPPTAFPIPVFPHSQHPQQAPMTQIPNNGPFQFPVTAEPVNTTMTGNTTVTLPTAVMTTFPPAGFSAPAPMSIMAAYGNVNATANATATAGGGPMMYPTQTVTVSPIAPPAPAFDPLAAEMARLSAAIAPAPAPVAPTGPTPAPTGPTPEQVRLAELCARIEAFGMGFPAISGELAKQYSAMKIAYGHTGYDPNAIGYAGTGQIAAHTIPDITILFKVLTGLQDLAAQRAQATAQAAGVANPLPPDAPPSSTPSTVQAPVQAPAHAAPIAALPTAPPGPSADEIKAAKEADKAAKKAAKEKEKEEKAAMKRAADEAEKALASMAPPAPAAYVAPAPAPAPAPVAPPAAYVAPAPVQSPIAPTEVVMYDPSTTRTAAPTSPVNFFVDTIVEGVQLTPLWPVIDGIWGEMSRDSACGDPRMSTDPANKYSHGRWKGILASSLRAAFERGVVPASTYGFDGSYGEIGGVVVEAIREISRRTGGVFVKGAR